MATIMAGILGLVAVIIRPAIDGLGKCIAEPIKRQFNYLCCFNNNVKDLESEAKKLGDARYDVQSRVTIAHNNAQIVTPQVLYWLGEVNEIQSKKLVIDDEITTTKDGCSTVRCGYSLSKKVKKMAEAMKELRQESDNFTTIANPPPPAAMVSINIRSTIEFDSRKCVEEEIMASLRDEETNMVGICGMGGVGKTTMAKTIMHRAREELGFQETVMAVVSQDVDMFKIQDDIAKSLGLTLSAEGSLSSKAHELRTRLKAGTRKSLVVIDDVWEKLEVEELGIPCNSARDCKVLITSRNRHILEAMDVEKLHAVKILSETEAWELFKSKAGNCIEQENVVAVARQVVDECKGLPLALVTVGVALKNKASTPLWDDALKQLKSDNPRHMPEVIKDVYQPLRLSYDFLEDDKQKSLFLMCCLFPEDSNIPLETLANFTKGLLHMNEDIKSSRDATFALVDRLKDRFLLLDGKDGNHVKMHDVVRDVAIFIAAEEKRIQCNECTWISSHIGERIGAHGESCSSPFPNLLLLWIDRESRDNELEIQNDFFNGMRELKVIMIKYWSLKRLPETIGLLENLRTLVLEGMTRLDSIYVVGDLVNLETLICRSCSIESLPVKIGRLSQLRLLELSCRKLYKIAPGIISNLIKLEELIVEDFGEWEAMEGGERKNPSLGELEHLSSLTLLKILIRDAGLATENLRLSPKKFDITIGQWTGYDNNHSWEKTLRLTLLRDINLGKWIHDCVRNVECMSLQGDGSRVVDLRVAQNLRQLDIINCSSVKNLVNMPFHQLEHLRLEFLRELEEICDISNFNKLSSIRIQHCGRLRTLFSLPAMESGSCLLQLKILEIKGCSMMEQVLTCNDKKQNQTNVHLFPKLEKIVFCYLWRLTSFIKGMQGIEFPQLVEIEIVDCPLLKELVCSGSPAHHHGDHKDSLHLTCYPHKVKFGKLGKLKVSLIKNLCLQAPMDSFTSLTMLSVNKLEGVKSLFSFSMIESNCLSQLEKLDISHCDMMEEVILWKQDENQMDIHITPFPKLKDLRLFSLPRLTSLGEGIKNIQLSLPDKMYISNCPLLETCASSPYDQNDGYRHFFCKPHHKVEIDFLKELEIGGSSDENMIRRKWCPQSLVIDLFTRLCKLDVWELKGMESLFPCSIARMMLNISFLGIRLCEEMVRVIEDDAEFETQTQTTHPILLFPNLESISLVGLPKLTSFCEWRCGLWLPQLLKLEIRKCDMMEDFTSGPLHTPNLQKLTVDNLHNLNDKDVKTALQLNRLQREVINTGNSTMGSAHWNILKKEKRPRSSFIPSSPNQIHLPESGPIS